MNRRNFLGAMLAACAAPAVVRAGSLMRINPAIVLPPMEIGRIESFRFVISEEILPPVDALGERIQLIRNMIQYGALKGNLR